MNKKLIYFLIIYFVIFQSCTIKNKIYYHYTKIIQNIIAPAKLVKEKLNITLFKEYAEVNADFFFEADNVNNLYMCYFPGEKYNIFIKNQTNVFRQPLLENFSIKINDKVQRFFIEKTLIKFFVSFKKNTRLSISYRTKYLLHKERLLFLYVLRTGSCWKGPINNLVINIYKKDNLNYKILPPYSKHKTFKKIEPTKDLCIEIFK